MNRDQDRRARTATFRLGAWTVEPLLNRLRRGDRTVALEPKVMRLLVSLARRRGEVITRDELLDQLWADSEPTPDALSHAMRELRRALGDDPRSPQLIETVRGLGYRLCVEPVIEAPPVLPEPPAPPQHAVPSPAAAATARGWLWLLLGALLLAAAGFTLH